MGTVERTHDGAGSATAVRVTANFEYLRAVRVVVSP
jgi:hypothetical protein